MRTTIYVRGLGSGPSDILVLNDVSAWIDHSWFLSQEFRAVLNYARETFFDQAIQHFVDFLARNVRASR